MDAILQSLNDESEAHADTYFWSESITTALIESFRKLLEASMLSNDQTNPI